MADVDRNGTDDSRPQSAETVVTLSPCQTVTLSSGGACPLPQSRYEHVLLGHGSGGLLTGELIQRVFLPGFGNEVLSRLEDQATIELDCFRKGQAPSVAFTTDSFVVRPLFFPGGDIGKLAVHGTVNDLAVGGAEPLFLSTAFILEEGLPIADLKRIVASMHDACRQAGPEGHPAAHRRPTQGLAQRIEELSVCRSGSSAAAGSGNTRG